METRYFSDKEQAETYAAEIDSTVEHYGVVYVVKPSEKVPPGVPAEDIPPQEFVTTTDYPGEGNTFKDGD